MQSYLYIKTLNILFQHLPHRYRFPWVLMAAENRGNGHHAYTHPVVALDLDLDRSLDYLDIEYLFNGQPTKMEQLFVLLDI